MAEGWNHLEVTSLTCLVVDDVSKLLPQWDVSWGCWLKHLLEPLCVVWASLQHNGLRGVSFLFSFFISFHSTLFYFIWWFSASIMRVCTGKKKLYCPVSGAIQWHFLCTLLVRSKSLNPTRFKGKDRTSPLSEGVPKNLWTYSSVLKPPPYIPSCYYFLCICPESYASCCSKLIGLPEIANNTEFLH